MVAIGIVERFEVIKIKEDDRQPLSISQVGQALIEPIDEIGPVGHSGQGIVQGCVLQPRRSA